MYLLTRGTGSNPSVPGYNRVLMQVDLRDGGPNRSNYARASMGMWCEAWCLQVGGDLFSAFRFRKAENRRILGYPGSHSVQGHVDICNPTASKSSSDLEDSTL